MNTTKFFFLILVVATFLKCSSFIEVAPPKDQLLTSAVFSNKESAISSLVGIYVKMVNDYSAYYIPLASGFVGDELDCYSNQTPLVELYNSTPRPADAFTNGFWNNGFFYIYQANSVIEGCDNSNGLQLDVKKQLKAEAHFIRAFWMYYLLNFFGDIPLVLNTDYDANAIVKRTPAVDIYRQIVMDLEYAVENLNPLYINGTSTTTTNERVRPNQSAARAMLARTHLAMGNWNEAEKLATLVINNRQLYDTVPINQVFLKDNKEAIWQLAEPVPRTSDFSTREAYGFVLSARPSTTLIGCSVISQWLLGAFESGDARKENWIGEYTDISTTPNQSFNFPNKYKIPVTTSSVITEQSTVLRLAEQYLIRAEARVRLENFEGAKEDINLIRRRARLFPIFSANKESLLKAILKERQTELFAEWGHRWIDIKRMGYADEIMPIVLEAKQAGAWNRNRELWPIPQTDIERNTNLLQNQGYN